LPLLPYRFSYRRALPWLRFVEEWFGQKKNAEIADLKDKIQALEESLKMAQEEITVLKMPPEAAAEEEEQ
jgi:hypothetical protein